MSENPEISLFSEDLIPPKAQNAFPEGFICRPLQRADFKKGHLNVLSDLAHIGEITEEMWTEQFDWMKQCNGTYYVVVIVEGTSGTVIGTGTLIKEVKL